MAPGTEFGWWRARMLGGRTNHWGRISLRFGPDDFRGKSLDGLGDDWPIGYDDFAPYYDRLDRLVGIFGSSEGLRNHPDGIFLPPPSRAATSSWCKQAADRLGDHLHPRRGSRSSPSRTTAAPRATTAASATAAARVNANFSSPDVLIAPGARDRDGSRSSPTPWRAR